MMKTSTTVMGRVMETVMVAVTMKMTVMTTDPDVNHSIQFFK